MNCLRDAIARLGLVAWKPSLLLHVLTEIILADEKLLGICKVGLL